MYKFPFPPELVFVVICVFVFSEVCFPRIVKLLMSLLRGHTLTMHTVILGRQRF